MKLGFTFHAPKNVGECEGMDPHILKWSPTLGVGVLMDFWIFRERLQGSNKLNWKVPYIIENLLKPKCFKWAHMTHLNFWNISYDQKKGRKLNWQCDSRALKVRNHFDFLACKWCATYCWKKLLTRATTLLQTSSQSKVCTQSYGPSKLREF